MGGFGVKRCDGNEHYFSVLSPEDLSISQNLNLPFDKDEYVYGGNCGGLLYFHGDQKGEIFIVNLTTDESIVVPPPDFGPNPDEGELRASGLGYDAKSGDYKIIRHYNQVYRDKADEDGYERYAGSKDFFELFSFKSFGSWKELRRPLHNGYVHDGTGVYVGETGSCYWVAYIHGKDDEEDKELEANFGTSPDHPFYHVLSFDFATERFGQFPLPATELGLKPVYKLVRYRGSLGTLVSDRYDPYATSSSSSSALSIQLFVRKGTLWHMLYVVSLADVARPLGLIDDRLLFVEARCPSGGYRRQSQLMVYDLDTEQLKKLDNIYDYDYPKCMSVISYGAESTDPPLPDFIPKANYDFSRKMRTSTKGKKKGKKGKKSRR